MPACPREAKQGIFNKDLLYGLGSPFFGKDGARKILTCQAKKTGVGAGVGKPLRAKILFIVRQITRGTNLRAIADQ